MSKIDKLTNRFLANPKALHYPHLEKVLYRFGFIKIPAKGSHVKFKHQRLKHDLIIPVHKNDCKDFYKDLARKIVLLNKLHQHIP